MASIAQAQLSKVWIVAMSSFVLVLKLMSIIFWHYFLNHIHREWAPCPTCYWWNYINNYTAFSLIFLNLKGYTIYAQNDLEDIHPTEVNTTLNDSATLDILTMFQRLPWLTLNFTHIERSICCAAKKSIEIFYAILCFV